MALGLGDAGFDVITAPGAAAGFDIASREQLDAIITDMNMPGTGGAQFIPEARSRWPHLPIIAISGAAIIDGRNTSDVARDLGADATLIKPFRARELAALIDRVLAARKPA
jgi:DNA-binding response OmpR family regulator